MALGSFELPKLPRYIKARAFKQVADGENLYLAIALVPAPG